MSVTVFPKRRVYPQTVKAREMYDQGEPSDEMVWAVCPRIEGRSFQRCMHCPKWEDSEYGKVQRGCYGLARETCQVVFAMQNREHLNDALDDDA